MSALHYVVVWGVAAIAAAIAAGLIAANRNRNYSAWAAWSLLLPPVVFVLLFLPNRETPHRRRTLDEQERDFHRN